LKALTCATVLRKNTNTKPCGLNSSVWQLETLSGWTVDLHDFWNDLMLCMWLNNILEWFLPIWTIVSHLIFPMRCLSAAALWHTY